PQFPERLETHGARRAEQRYPLHGLIVRSWTLRRRGRGLSAPGGPVPLHALDEYRIPVYIKHIGALEESALFFCSPAC
ncbi:MAG TPA: hypothetical protein VK092_03820, partial [Deinococcales bacterium]|nr:hypothetical protein [Deinococcales bacterium]